MQDQTDALACRSAIYRKINWRILPLLTLGFICAAIDRHNIAFAKLQMQQDTGISDMQYGLAAGIFFIAYVLFEVPSSALLSRIGSRKTFSRIMILWGFTSAAMLFVHDARSFYLLRFLLGVFEAGFAPGVFFYLARWYPEYRLARAVALFMCASPLSGIISSPLSGWLMTTLAGVCGLTGWQWMFLAEGLPCVALGGVILFCIDDRPSQAKWLSEQEKALLHADLLPHSASVQKSFRCILKDRCVYAMAFIDFCLVCGAYVVIFWLPTLLKNAGVAGMMQIGLLSSVPYIVAIAPMIFFGVHSDHRLERRWHIFTLTLVSALALCISAIASGNLILSLISNTLALAGILTAIVIVWATVAAYLKGAAAAPGIAFINSIAQLGGFVSPALIGWTRKVTGGFQTGLFIMASLLFAACLTLICARLPKPVKR